MVKATGQFTIIDYNDALTLSSFISSNQAKTQLYNPDNNSFNPDWSKAPFLVLTASLYKIGTTSDIITSSNIKSVKYYEIIDGEEKEITATLNREFSGINNHILTIKANEMETVNAKDYICRIVYTDDSTNLDIIQKCSVSFSKIQNGSGLVNAVASTPNGNIFKNNEVASLTGVCELWKGSKVDDNVSYQWYMQDSTVTDDQGAGVGWKKLTDINNKWKGVTTKTLTIYPSAFNNIGVFKCGVKDIDIASPSYNTTFWDTVTFIDNTDPLIITITSTGGSTFKNGEGTSILRALVYQAGYEIDVAGTEYTYKWYKYDKDGILDQNFGGEGVPYKTGKAISITTTDVNVKSTFQCEID